MPSAVGYQPPLADEMGELQAHPLTRGSRITSMQAVYVRLTTTPTRRRGPRFAHLDAHGAGLRNVFSKGIFRPLPPGVAPTSGRPRVVGDEHIPRGTRKSPTPAGYTTFRTSSPSVIDELSRRGQALVNRARRIERFLSADMMAAEAVHRQPVLDCPG